jgi:class 3 adenylate cyclase
MMSSSVTATFVFTDLVDSTATAARLGPGAAEELGQTHFRLLRGAVAASGWAVESVRAVARRLPSNE